MYTIKIENLKGIKRLVFPFPEKKGVYVLTGANGCGKTSLLVALNRLGDNLAFSNYNATSGGTSTSIDTFKNSEITFSSDTSSVTYKRKGVRWAPAPRNGGRVLTQFPYSNTIFISASGNRFFSQEIIDTKRPTLEEVSQNIISPLNKILQTNKFDNLKFITVRGKKGRQIVLHRANKLYVIKDGSTIYSEQQFSLGERLLLNTLDLLENIQPKTLLLIDEVELALHPVAQVGFYDYLREQAKVRDLVVIISTHSSTLIKHSDNRIYLENKSRGNIAVLTNCYPSYILRDVAALEEQEPDKIFFVEDRMAQCYLQKVLRKFLNDEGLRMVTPVVPIAGYRELLQFIENFPAVNIDKKKIHAFFDKDVEDVYKDITKKNVGRSTAENELLDLFKKNKGNYSFLSITPEQGVWEWIEKNSEVLANHIDNIFGNQSFDVKRLVANTSTEELINKGSNPRSWAKGCFKNFKEKVNQNNPSISEDKVVETMIDCYVENAYSRVALQPVLKPILNR